MPKLKCWEKFQFDKNNQRWRNEKNLTKEVRVAGPTKITKPVGYYFVEITGHKTIFKKAKQDALDIAMSYMGEADSC